MTLYRFISLLTTLSMLPTVATAGGTRIWELAGLEELEMGELDGTRLTGRGEIRLGLQRNKLAMDPVGVVWSAALGNGGEIYLGTGYEGKLYRKRGSDITMIAETGQLVITAIAVHPSGDLYLATLPDSTILRIKNPGRGDKPATPEKWAALPDTAEHVFSLVFSTDAKTLFAGTGPKGVLFAIGLDRQPRAYLETEEEHVLSLAIDANGDLLAGTSPSSRLLRVSGPGRAAVLADFQATEVKSIAVGREGIYAAVNEFRSPPKVPKKSTAPATSNKETASVIGDGAIYAVDPKGRQSLLWKQKKAHVVQLALAQSGTLYAGLGSGGKVIAIEDERHVSTALDLDERQVMTLVAGKDLLFAGTGDAGAAYEVLHAHREEATYLSPILETTAVSDWGHVTWTAEGSVTIYCRSGNTTKPDARWSGWSKPLKNGAAIPSPPAKYLQLRVSFAPDPNARFISAQIAFKPQNLRAIITHFDPGSPFPKPSHSDDNLSDRTISARPDFEADPKLSIQWKVTNPDDDDLRYRLWYRAVGETLWRPILRDDQVLESTRYTWDTSAVPEGTYQLQLTADDSLSNDPREVLTDTAISVPVDIDNNPPVVTRLAVQNGIVSGVAADTFSKIAAIDISIDNGPWIPLTPEDGIYDETRETFKAPLPSPIADGPHAAAVRAFDRKGNMGVGEILFTK